MLTFSSFLLIGTFFLRYFNFYIYWFRAYRIQAHFENIQRIADMTTLPHAIQHLHNRIEEDLGLSHLTERLMMGKGQPNTLTLAEKLDLWENLKILSMK